MDIIYCDECVYQIQDGYCHKNPVTLIIPNNHRCGSGKLDVDVKDVSKQDINKLLSIICNLKQRKTDNLIKNTILLYVRDSGIRLIDLSRTIRRQYHKTGTFMLFGVLAKLAEEYGNKPDELVRTPVTKKITLPKQQKAIHKE